MSTALAAQLAQIRSSNVNPLDLKAQRQAHSQSLLFEPSHAANQDFDTLYQLCLESFEELCQLDARFIDYANSIFGSQSRTQDRNQMNKTQNEELNVVLEGFLCLVGARITLKPALRAIEWLIRRFRVHEKNTVVFVLTFLPYHTLPIFTTVLSLIPSEIPQELRFLYPYKESLANPPRHAIVHATSGSKALLGTLSAFVIEACHKKYHYQALTSFWAALATESLVSMADRARSARLSAQREKHEEVLRFILPVLNEAFSIPECPDLRIGCYMIMTALVAKLDLERNVLETLMLAVVQGWEETSHAGMICLSVLAERIGSGQLPRKVSKAILALPGLDDDLLILGRQYPVDRLGFGVTLALLARFRKGAASEDIAKIRRLVNGDMLSTHSLSQIVRSMISTDGQVRKEPKSANNEAEHKLIDLVQELADTERIGEIVQIILQDLASKNGEHLPPRLRQIVETSTSDSTDTSGDPDAIEVDEERVDFDALVRKIDDRLAYDFSFLGHSESYVYGSLANTFRSIHDSKHNVKKFSDLPVLRKSLAMREPLFLSFFIRVWCSYEPPPVRTRAIKVVRDQLRSVDVSSDVQLLLPYIVYALSDKHRQVRQAAADLLRTLSERCSTTRGERTEQNILGQDQIYGQNPKSKDLIWLADKDARRFVTEVLEPSLEECTLDVNIISSLLRSALEGSRYPKYAKSQHKDLKSSTRSSIFSFLCSHVVNSSLYKFKIRMLRILNGIEKIGGLSRTKLLLPLLSDIASYDSEQVARLRNKHVDFGEFCNQAIGIISPHDRDGLQHLRELISGGSHQCPLELKNAAFSQIPVLWPQLVPESADMIAKALFELVMNEYDQRTADHHDEMALETLQTLSLPTATIHSFLEDIPSLFDKAESSPNKRRKMNGGDVSTPRTSIHAQENSVRKASTVLELLDSSKAAKSPELISPLFIALSTFLRLDDKSNQALAYLQVLAMEDLQAIIEDAVSSKNKSLDISSIRVDVLVDCIGTTDHPQVRTKALLLITMLADLAPDAVLHNVMPIFTYMGATVFAQDDEFSAHVVQQTMECVVSRLATSLQKGTANAFSGICELLLNFAAAFEHIPSQRRIGLYHSLMSKVGPSDYLFALLVMLSDKFPSDQRVAQFVPELCDRFDALTQMITAEHMLRTVWDAWQPQIPSTVKILFSNHACEGAEVGMKVLPYVRNILQSGALRLKVSKAFKGDADKANLIRESCGQVLELLLDLSIQTEKANTSVDVCQQLPDSMISILPTSELILVFEKVFSRSANRLGRRILQALESRLNAGRGLTSQTFGRECLEFVPQLLKNVEGSKDTDLQVSAVRAVDKIFARFGKTDIDGVVRTTSGILSMMDSNPSERGLMAVSLLCFATMIEIAREAMIPVIPDIFSKALECLDVSIGEATEDPDLHNACFSLFLSVLLYVPWIVTGSSLDRLLVASYESANADMGASCDKTRLQAMGTLPNGDNAKDCLSALSRTWKSAITEGPKAATECFELVKIGVERQSKAKVREQSEVLSTLFLDAFDLRRIQLTPRTEDSYEDEEIEEVESAVNQTAVAVIYKLNDTTFRPMFSRFLEWAMTPRKGGGRNAFRQISIYSFFLKFFSTLKSIVTNYVALIIDSAVDILNSTNPKDPVSMQLWHQVISTLRQTFDNDQDEFFQSPSHFTPLCTTLLLQIQHAPSLSPAQLADDLLPTITALAAAAESSTQYKELNSGILAHARSDTPAVRLAAVKLELSLTERLGEEWLALLPEMLPFVNELLEDDDEKVESETRRWVRRIEEELGESIEPMLQ